MVQQTELNDKVAEFVKDLRRRLARTPEFLSLLFSPADWVSIRCVETWTEDARRRSRVNFGRSGARTSNHLRDPYQLQMLEYLAGRNMENVFFACAPRFGEKGFDEAWQIRRVKCLWADLDSCSVDEAKQRCRGVGLPDASIIVNSGNGVHVYWLLEAPFLIEDVDDPPQVRIEWITVEEKRKPVRYYVDPADGEKVYLSNPETGRPIPHSRPELSPKAQQVQDVLAGIAAKIGGDHTHDLARLLRVPGTMNRKDQRNGREPKLCEVVEMEDCRYAFSDFQTFRTESPVAQRREKVKKIVLPAPKKITPSRQDKLNELIAVCDAAPPGHRSEADFSLCCYATRQGVAKDELWPMVQHIGKFAERGERYFDLTWGKAANCVRGELYDKALRKVNATASSSDGRADDADVTDASQPGDDRPEIEVTTDEHLVNEQAVAALARDPDIYQRGGTLVRIIQEEGDGKDGIQRPTDSPRIVPIPEAFLRDRLSANAKFYRVFEVKDGKKKEFVPPPAWCVKAVHAYRSWPGMRHLEGISQVPILRPDGTIVTLPGYDSCTRIVYRPAGPIPEICDDPTRTDALAARDSLLDLVVDFPFSEDVHRAAWLASLLSVVGRPAYSGPTPLFLIDSNTRGSGKGLLSDVTGEVTTGRSMARMANPKDDDEARKRITALVINGDGLALIDNVESALGSASLDAALTTNVWKDRLLGKNQIIEMPLMAVWFATGNNVVLGADTTRRVCHIRLESPEENPEERSGFKYANLLAHVRKERMQYLVAGLTILRAYFVTGRPKKPLKPWGSYEGWSDLIRQAIVWIGLPDPAETRQELASRVDTVTDALHGLIAGWKEIDPAGDGLTANEALSRLEAMSDRYELLRDAVCTLCHAPAGGLPAAKSLGRRLQQVCGRVCGGKTIDYRKRNNIKVWFVRAVKPDDTPKTEDGDADPIFGPDGV